MIPLPVASYQTRTGLGTRLLNCYIEQPPKQGKAGPLLLGSPGIKSWTTVGTSIRGMHRMGSTPYVVSGTTLYSVNSTGGATSLGTVSGTVRVQMADNGTQLAILAQPDLYVYASGALTKISDYDYTSRGASSVQFFDNYLTLTEPNSGRWFHSDLSDFTAFDPLNFATAEGSPDNLVGHIVDHRQAFLAGTTSCELWDNVGGSGSPFARSSNGFIEIGCAAGRSLAKLDNSVMWLASDDRGDLTVRRLDGITPVRVSTHAVEQSLKDYGDVSEAHAFSTMFEGHAWYVLTVPNKGTWVYDGTTGEWHERRTYQYDYWRVDHFCYAYGKHLVAYGDAVGELDAQTYAEFGNSMVSQWTYPSVYAERRRAFHNRLEIALETGVGLATGQGSDPVISLEVSDDGGRTWEYLPDKSIGKQGEYRDRAVWHRLGSSRDRIYRASISDPVRRAVYDTQLEVEGGRL